MYNDVLVAAAVQGHLHPAQLVTAFFDKLKLNVLLKQRQSTTVTKMISKVKV